MLRTIRMPAPAMVVACIALLLVLGGVERRSSDPGTAEEQRRAPRNSRTTLSPATKIKNNAGWAAKIASNAVGAREDRGQRRDGQDCRTGEKVQDGSLAAARLRRGRPWPSADAFAGRPHDPRAHALGRPRFLSGARCRRRCRSRDLPARSGRGCELRREPGQGGVEQPVDGLARCSTRPSRQANGGQLQLAPQRWRSRPTSIQKITAIRLTNTLTRTIFLYSGRAAGLFTKKCRRSSRLLEPERREK